MKAMRLALVLAIVSALTVPVAYADILNGKKLFNNPKFAGSRNDKSCNSCHPDGRGVEKAWNKTKFSIMGREKDSLEDTVNLCISMALKGKPIRKDSRQMNDIVQYIKSLKGKKFKRKVIRGC